MPYPVGMSLSGGATFNSSTIEKTVLEKHNSIPEPFETTLLNEVRKAKLLYYNHDPDYNNTDKNRLHWLMIAEKCKRTVSECVRKWHSLLRIYFALPPEFSWIYRRQFIECEPHLTNHKLLTPSTDQKLKLFEELLNNRKALQKPETKPKEHHRIWLQIISKCNKITPGVIMSVINWQRYWMLQKQNFAERFYAAVHHNKNNLNIAEKYSADEMKIIEICCATTRDSLANIIAALGRHFEFGTNKHLILPRCNKCHKQPNEILYYNCCSNCDQRPTFCSICENASAFTVFIMTQWSKQALELLPVELRQLKRLAVCAECKNKLNRKSSIIWKICRVCEIDQPLILEALQPNDDFRSAFKEATRIEFNEKDGLPGYICKNCKIQINKFSEFVKKFRQTQFKLQYMHVKHFIDISFNNNSNLKFIETIKKSSDNEKNIQTNNNNIKPQIKTAKLDKLPEFKTNIIKKIPSTEVVPIKIIPNQKKSTRNDNDHDIDDCVEVIIPEQKKTIPSQQSITIDSDDDIDNCEEIIPDQKKLERNEIMIDDDNTPPIMNFIATPATPKITIKDIFSLQESSHKEKSSSISKRVEKDSFRILNGKILKPTVRGTPPPPKPSSNIFPTKTSSINTKKTSLSSFASRTEQILQQQKSRPNKIMKLCPTAASKPAIFTIPTTEAPSASLAPPVASSAEPLSVAQPTNIATDYETIDDALPVFCIPKNPVITTQDNNFPSNADQQLINFSPSPSKIIKIEKNLNDEIPTEYQQNIHNPIEDLPQHRIPSKPRIIMNKSENNNNTKVVRINGELVTVKPHPYLDGLFVPINNNDQNQKSGSVRYVRLKQLVQRKVIENVEKPIIPSEQFQGAQIICNEEKKGEQLLQQQQQEIKKSRKYWGNVDEFQSKTPQQKSVAYSLAAIKAKFKRAFNNRKVINLVDGDGLASSSSGNPSSFSTQRHLNVQINDEEVAKSTAPNTIRVKRKYTKRAIHLFDKSGESGVIEAPASNNHPSIQSPLNDVQIKEEEISYGNTDNIAATKTILQPPGGGGAPEAVRVKRKYVRKIGPVTPRVKRKYVRKSPSSSQCPATAENTTRVKRKYVRKIPLGTLPINRVKRAYRRRCIHLLDKNERPDNDHFSSCIQSPSKNVQIKEEEILPNNNYDNSDAVDVASFQSQFAILNNCNTINKNLKDSSFKLKKLRVVIKRDKRIRMMAASNLKKICRMQ